MCAYDPVGYGVPYNHLMFTDSREQLVEGALQVLCVTMENESGSHNVSVDGTSGGTAMEAQSDVIYSQSHLSSRFFISLKYDSEIQQNHSYLTSTGGETNSEFVIKIR